MVKSDKQLLYEEEWKYIYLKRPQKEAWNNRERHFINLYDYHTALRGVLPIFSFNFTQLFSKIEKAPNFIHL